MCAIFSNITNLLYFPIISTINGSAFVKLKFKRSFRKVLYRDKNTIKDSSKLKIYWHKQPYSTNVQMVYKKIWYRCDSGSFSQCIHDLKRQGPHSAFFQWAIAIPHIKLHLFIKIRPWRNIILKISTEKKKPSSRTWFLFLKKPPQRYYIMPYNTTTP